jgi:hypothetical protein
VYANRSTQWSLLTSVRNRTKQQWVVLQKRTGLRVSALTGSRPRYASSMIIRSCVFGTVDRTERRRNSADAAFDLATDATPLRASAGFLPKGVCNITNEYYVGWRFTKETC